MGDDDRSIGLTAACDDLEAQLEAGDRSVRRIDDDLTELGARLTAVFEHTAALAGLLRHMRELRVTMREQRNALQEVRAAATVLCTAVTETRQNIDALAGERLRFELDTVTAGVTDRISGAGEDRSRRAAAEANTRKPGAQSSLAPTPDINKSRTV
jgi:multidrug resistance efflux pump